MFLQAETVPPADAKCRWQQCCVPTLCFSLHCPRPHNAPTWMTHSPILRSEAAGCKSIFVTYAVFHQVFLVLWVPRTHDTPAICAYQTRVLTNAHKDKVPVWQLKPSSVHAGFKANRCDCVASQPAFLLGLPEISLPC